MNTWHAEPIDETTTCVYFEPERQSAGLIGRVMMPLFMLVGRRMAHDTLDDLKVYVETGEPSARNTEEVGKAAVTGITLNTPAPDGQRDRFARGA